MTPLFGPLGTVVLFVIAIFVARLAIRTARSPQGATGWVVFLLSFPLLALPAYAVFGGIYRMNRHRAPRTTEPTSGEPAITEARLSDLQTAVRSQLTAGNRISLLIDGSATFDAVFEAMNAAETEILVQYYTLRDDDLGQKLKAHLIDARRRGVTVRVLIDAMGSFTLSRSYIRELREEGIDFRGNFSVRRSFHRLGLNFRDHRKMVVVDGKLGFTGGLNASRLYVDGGEAFDGWRDTFVRLEGPVVTQLRDCFALGWRARAEEGLPEPETSPREAGGMRAMHVALGPTDEQDIGLLLLLGLIGKARERLWLTTPYLVPPPEIAAALKLAAERGVDVRLILPRPIDKYLPWLASRGYFQDLSAYGIGIHEFDAGFMHQKVILVDDDIASVGTINLDFRSIMLNFEQTVLVEDKDFCAEVAAMLEADIARSNTFDGGPQAWWIRVFAPAAQLLSPVL